MVGSVHAMAIALQPALTRSTGIVAIALSVLALTGGFLFSARETGRRRRPSWWLDLHNRVGGLAVGALFVHVGSSLLDRTSGIRLLDALVPGSAPTDRVALALGVLAFYFLVATAFTTWPRRLRSRSTWRVIHLGSVPAVGLAVVHGVQMGSDGHRIAYEAGVIAAAGAATYALGVRFFDDVLRRRVRAR
jgi:DMSO/TMAO reductase YedYZ heme-binding membrane subunit